MQEAAHQLDERLRNGAHVVRGEGTARARSARDEVVEEVDVGEGEPKLGPRRGGAAVGEDFVASRRWLRRRGRQHGEINENVAHSGVVDEGEHGAKDAARPCCESGEHGIRVLLQQRQQHDAHVVERGA